MYIEEFRYKSGWGNSRKWVLECCGEEHLNHADRLEHPFKYHFVIGAETLCGRSSMYIIDPSDFHSPHHTENCSECMKRFFENPELVEFYRSDLITIPKTFYNELISLWAAINAPKN